MTARPGSYYKITQFESYSNGRKGVSFELNGENHSLSYSVHTEVDPTGDVDEARLRSAVKAFSEATEAIAANPSGRIIPVVGLEDRSPTDIPTVNIDLG